MNRKTILTSITALLIFSAACAMPIAIRPNEELIEQAAQQTVQAYMTQIAPTDTPDLLEPSPTATETPTATVTIQLTATTQPLQPTATPQAQPTATPKPCNQSVFISETVPDGTVMSANESFTKSWRVKNIGTCTWNPNYRLIFYSGNQMGGPNSIKLNKYIAPGEQVDLLVNLKAPSETGTYTGYWRLQAEDGFRFGQVYTTIKVAGAPFAVTSVKLSASPASFNGTCPVNVLIKANISTNAAGKVTYYWKRDNNFKSKIWTLNFNSKGTKTVEHQWKITNPGTHTIRIYIDEPNHQWFPPHEIKVTCN